MVPPARAARARGRCESVGLHLCGSWMKKAVCTLLTISLCHTTNATSSGESFVQYGRFWIENVKDPQQVYMMHKDPCSSLIEESIHSSSCKDMDKFVILHVGNIMQSTQFCRDDYCDGTNPLINSMAGVDFSKFSIKDVDLLQKFNFAAELLASLFAILTDFIIMANEAHDATVEELNQVSIQLNFRSFHDLDDQASRLGNWHNNLIREWNAVEKCVMSLKDWENRLPSEDEVKKQRKTYGERIDKDSRSYVDKQGNTCRTWQGFNCEDDPVEFGYSELEQKTLRVRCGESCAMGPGNGLNSIENSDWWKKGAPGPNGDDWSSFVVPVDPYDKDRQGTAIRRQQLFNVAITSTKCEDKAKLYATYNMEMRPKYTRDNALMLKKKCIIQAGRSKVRLNRFSMASARVMVLVGLILSFLFTKFLDIFNAWFFRAMVPVLTVCSNSQTNEANELLSQCFYRSDQFDALGLLSLTAQNVTYYSEAPSKTCPWNCKDGTGGIKRMEENYKAFNWRYLFSPYYNYMFTSGGRRSVRAQDDHLSLYYVPDDALKGEGVYKYASGDLLEPLEK